MRRRTFLLVFATAVAALFAPIPSAAFADGKDDDGRGGKNGKGNGEKGGGEKDGKDGKGGDGGKGGKDGKDGSDGKDGKGEKSGKGDGGKGDGASSGEKGEKGEKPPPPKEKDPKETAAWKECEAIGAEFAARSSKALVARVRPGTKLDLRVGNQSGRFAADQAAEVLDEWFKGKGELTVKLRSVKDLIGSFDLTVRRAGSDRDVKRQLVVEIRRREKGEGFHLVRLGTE